MKLGISTNGSTSMQEQKIRQLGITDLMDEALILGDHPLVDVRGAFEAGLTKVSRYTPH